jgi:hypothetical protein
VAFSYGGSGAQSESEASDSGSSDEDEESDAEPEDEEHADVDGLAANLGIDAFSVLLRRAEREEAEMAQGIFKKRKCVPVHQTSTMPAWQEMAADAHPCYRLQAEIQQKNSGAESQAHGRAGTRSSGEQAARQHQDLHASTQRLQQDSSAGQPLIRALQVSPAFMVIWPYLSSYHHD